MDRLVTLNMDVARAVAARYARRGEPLEDLEQTALLELLRAARAFDPAKGGDFLSYAIPCMRGSVTRLFRDGTWMIRPPRRVQERHLRLRAAADEHVHEGSDVKTCFRPVSLDAPAGAPGTTRLGDLIADAANGCDRDTRLTLLAAVAMLPPRTRAMLHMRFVQDLTQAEIAASIGVSQYHVSRLLQQCFDELRPALVETGVA